MGNDFDADHLSGQACGHARFIRTSPRRRSDRDRCGGYHQSHRSPSRSRHDRIDRAVHGDFAQSWCGSSSNAGLHLDGIDRTAGRRSHTIDRPGRVILRRRVLLGTITGAALRWAEPVVLPLVIRPVDPACKWASPLSLNHCYQIASVHFRRKKTGHANGVPARLRTATPYTSRG